MDRETLRAISYEKYREYLEDSIYDDIEILLNLNKGHSAIHDNLSTSEMLTRLIEEDKTAVSCFYSTEQMESDICDAVYNQSDKIAKWFTSDRIDFRNQKIIKNLLFNLI